MATLDFKPPRTKAEPELNLLLPKSAEQPLWKSLFQNLDDYFFPKKQPPLVLTSKPVPVKDIWGFYDYKKSGVVGSTVVHILTIAAIVGLTIAGRHVVQEVTKKQEVVTYVATDDIPPLPPAKTISVRNEHPKLTAEPAVAVPPQIHIAMNNLPNLGDPMSRLPSGPPSNGTGSGGGIGSGSGGGVGVGTGPGVGEGRGGGTGGGVFRVGGGVSAPKAIYQPEPEYSEEARKAKYQGTCVLWLIVGPDGKPRDIKVSRNLGMGLDEKAIQAVKTWKFEPAMKDGKPVAVEISVEVEFRLY